jgi:3-dehydro-L-gulonate 2-dehydrogenase
MKLHYQDLEKTLKEKLEKYGFSSQDAGVLSTIFSETTFDGVFSHGINRFPRFLGDVKDGTVKPGIIPQLIQGMDALEQWDGKGGPGILNALRATERSMELARKYGLGCVGLRNANHWMRGGTYGWKAADAGFMFMGWTNTLPNMPPWGGDKAAMGNNPFIMAIPREEGHIVLDMAMSQFSYGKLEWHERCGTDLPFDGGFDSHNELTRNPSEILKTERILPTGLWKGSGLSMVLDLAAAVLTGGNTTRQIGQLPKETNLSQVYISIDIERHMGKVQREELIESTLRYVNHENPDALYPGQRSLLNRKRYMDQGVEIPEETWEEIQAL